MGQEGTTSAEENTAGAAPPYTPRLQHPTAAAAPLAAVRPQLLSNQYTAGTNQLFDPQDEDLSRAILESLRIDPADEDLSRAILESLNVETVTQPSISGTRHPSELPIVIEDDRFPSASGYLQDVSIENNMGQVHSTINWQNPSSQFLSAPVRTSASTYQPRPSLEPIYTVSPLCFIARCR